jgi:branched-chain amino acid transport system substrate-binding protein
MMSIGRSGTLVLAGALAVSALVACGRADEGGDGGGAVVLGTSLPLTGSLQSFGTSLQLGYQRAIDEVNAQGGVDVGGTRREVQLAVQDNASDGNKAAEQAKSLVLENNAIALLGPATPTLTIPVSVAAEQLQVPLVSTITPIRAWKGATQSGWRYSWDLFFDELQMTRTQFEASDLVETNKKVALFTDQEEDGIVMGGLWEQAAPAAGYTIVSRAQFPVGNTNFGSQVTEAKNAGADIVIAQVIPPDGISLLREMKAQGWAPKLVFIEKGGNTGGYPELSEGLADGTLAANWFAEGMGLQQESTFISTYRNELGGVNSELGCVVYGYSAARVVLDAIGRAGSTDPEAINDSVGQTDADYPAGHIAFDDTHAAALPAVQTQWDGVDMKLVLTADGKVANSIATPATGLG